jgi:hypothetical protein
MLGVTYQFFCDVCGSPGEPSTHYVPTGGMVPHPDAQVVMNNAALCQTCAELAVPAMNDALKDRLKKPSEGVLDQAEQDAAATAGLPHRRGQL